MKTLYENIDYDIELNVIDEDPSSCTFSVSCSRMDLVTITQDLVELNKFTLSISELDQENILIKFTYIIIDNEGHSNTSYEYALLKNSIVNDNRYYIKSEADDLFVKLIDYKDSDVLNKVKNVDGSGSGLNGDLLNGFNLSSTPNPDSIPISDSVGKFPKGWIAYPPVIEFINWNNNSHHANNSYVLTINTIEPQGQDLTYEVTCNDANVEINQSATPNIWTVTYPDYAFNMEVIYDIKVTNESGLIDSLIDIKIIKIHEFYPVITIIDWDEDIHEENESYQLTITAYDPQSQDLTYEVTCDDPTVGVVQSGTPQIWNMTYGEYTENTIITYTITVTNESLLSAVKIDTIVVINIPVPPVIDNLAWDDNYHEENESYQLTITAHDPKGLDLTYGVVCDDVSVGVVQSGTPNIWDITYGEYGADTDVIYTITVTNEDLLTDIEIDNKTVHNSAAVPGDIGIFGGGDTGSISDVIDYVTISTLGNAIDFGDLTIARYSLGSTSNGANDRGVFVGGIISGYNTKTIDYVTISTPGNAIVFGDLIRVLQNMGATSNGTNERGIIGGGRDNANLDEIGYITISSLGNATYFGDLSVLKRNLTATSNGTNERGVFAGGFGAELYDEIEYITISTPGNVIDFGDLTTGNYGLIATSNGINERGVFGGGRIWTITQVIDYITISTLGNATYFGDLTLIRVYISATSNGINERGVFGGGDDGSVYVDIIEYITISTPGNAIDFGDLTLNRSELAATSNA